MFDIRPVQPRWAPFSAQNPTAPSRATAARMRNAFFTNQPDDKPQMNKAQPIPALSACIVVGHGIPRPDRGQTDCSYENNTEKMDGALFGLERWPHWPGSGANAQNRRSGSKIAKWPMGAGRTGQGFIASTFTLWNFGPLGADRARRPFPISMKSTEKYKDKDLVVIGQDCWENKRPRWSNF